MHDFQLFKDSVVNVSKLIKFLADSGYQGINDYFPNSEMGRCKRLTRWLF